MASRDPSLKRGSAGASTPQLIYPINGNMKFYTRLEFYEYDRRIETDGARKQTNVIILPVPTNITDNSGLNINSNNLGMFENIANAYRAGEGVVNGSTQISADGIMSDISGKIDAAMGDVTGALAAIAALTPGVSDLSIGNFAEIQSGIVRNPHTTSAFNGVQLKRFNFDWRVSPRSSEEGDRLLQVFDTIRRRIHPQYNESVKSYAFDYPDLVKVSFVNTKGLPAVDFAFVERFSVTSFPQGPAFYKDGLPVEASFSLELIETDVRTRNSYEGR